jgi:glycosyltransferase involved in cell wall biosynthesis
MIMSLSQRLQSWLLHRGSIQEKLAGPVLMVLRDVLQTPLDSGPGQLLPTAIRNPLRRNARSRRAARVIHQEGLLMKIIQQHAGIDPVIIFPPGLSWDKQLFQRPQQIARALARQGALVFYMEASIPNGSAPFQEEAERLYLCRVPIETFWALDRPVVYTLTWMLRRYWLEFDSARLIYDYVDDLDVFAGSSFELRRNHIRLLQTANVVLATADRLLAQAREQRPDVVYCPNGGDYTHFSRCRQPYSGLPPHDLAPTLAQGKPIIGYYGALARWLDANLLKQVANRRDDFSFILIGPILDGTIEASGLLYLPNVCWLDAKPYALLPEYLRFFDVAIIPFKLGDVSHATSPVKLFEYMAAGKPVVITPMRESLKYPGVLAGEDAEQFEARLEEALKLKESPVYLETLDRVARANTWDTRARLILETLGKV